MMEVEGGVISIATDSQGNVSTLGSHAVSELTPDLALITTRRDGE
jgi:hypothetical protein